MIDWSDLLNRNLPARPWQDGDKIPWDDPDFSRRMLKEHLSQKHDAASRRFEVIDDHIRALQRILPENMPAQILDLCCGPGLYAHRLAKLGHALRAIDFSPASIEYAIDRAGDEGLKIEYSCEDIRHADYGAGYDLAMIIFGEFNVFRKEDAKKILRKIHSALAENGQIIIECHNFETVKKIGKQKATWETHETGLFSDKSHILLQEHFWDETAAASVSRYFVIDFESGNLERHSQTMQAYTDDEYMALLKSCGFYDIQILPKLGETDDAFADTLIVLRARK